MTFRVFAAALFAALPLGASAEVKFAAADGFLIEHRYPIDAPASKVWESLQHPERWDGGSAEHGRVIMVSDGKLLRMRAALGPLQEMAVAGVISVALEEKDGATTVVVTHRVSGDPAHKLDALAPIVDQVNARQFSGLVGDVGGRP